MPGIEWVGYRKCSGNRCGQGMDGIRELAKEMKCSTAGGGNGRGETERVSE